MKNTILKSTFFTTFFVAILFNINCAAQENIAKNYRMLYKFKTVKHHDNTRLLEVSFIARNKKDKKDKPPVYDVDINFYTAANGEEILLGQAKTSKEGIAQLILPADQKYATLSDGYINLIARFEGSEALKAQEKEIMVKDVNLNLDLTVADSIKTIVVNAFSLDSLGNKMPVEEADINFYIEGMLSKMKIMEGTIEDGSYEFEFPTDIPGDVNGDVTVYAMIEDNDDFGDVIQKNSENWGVFNKQIKSEENKLWSNAAPVWMYIVLTILLVGVWANYIYTMVNLFKIRKEGKALEEA